MAVDLFDSIKELHAGRKVDEHPGPFILHRFLASEKDYAEICREVQRTTTDPELTFEIWRAFVGGTRAPRFKYVGPPKQAKADALVLRLIEREHLSREDAETAVHLLTLAKKLDDACAYYGVER
jgi:hypothetical protein